MMRWIGGVLLVGGCALFFNGSAKVVSQTADGGTVEMTGKFDPRDSEEKAFALIDKHCGAQGYTVRQRYENQITYTCGREEAGPAGPAQEHVPEFADCIPSGGRVKSIELAHCCSGRARDVPYEELDECE